MMYKGELSFHRSCFDYDSELVWIFNYTLDVKNYSHRFPSAFKYENAFQKQQCYGCEIIKGACFVNKNDIKDART